MKTIVAIFAVLTICGLTFSRALAAEPPRNGECDDTELAAIQHAIEDFDSDNVEVREAASKVARQIVQKEIVRIDNVVRAEFPIITSFDQYAEIDARIKVLEHKSCVFLLLRQAIKSSNPEVAGRAQEAVLPPPSPLDGAIFSLED